MSDDVLSRSSSEVAAPFLLAKAARDQSSLELEAAKKQTHFVGLASGVP